MLAKTIPSNRIKFIFYCGFLPSHLSCKTKEQIKTDSVLNVRFSLFLMEARPQKCLTCLHQIHRPFILLNLCHVSLSLPFFLPTCKAHITSMLQILKDTAFTQQLGIWLLQILVQCIVYILIYPFIKSQV